MKTANVPVAEVVYAGRGHIVIVYPYCGREHQHADKSHAGYQQAMKALKGAKA